MTSRSNSKIESPEAQWPTLRAVLSWWARWWPVGSCLLRKRAQAVSKGKNRRPALGTAVGVVGAAAAGGALVLAQRGQRRHRSAPQDGPRIVILGSGFAGLTAAEKLAARI